MGTYKAKPRVDLSNLVPGVVGGTYNVMGEITSLKRVHNRFDAHNPRYTIWVQSGNNRFFGTLPRHLLGASVGSWIEFRAEVEQSPDNRHVGFFKRPRKV